MRYYGLAYLSLVIAALAACTTPDTQRASPKVAPPAAQQISAPGSAAMNDGGGSCKYKGQTIELKHAAAVSIRGSSDDELNLVVFCAKLKKIDGADRCIVDIPSVDGVELTLHPGNSLLAPSQVLYGLQGDFFNGGEGARYQLDLKRNDSKSVEGTFRGVEQKVSCDLHFSLSVEPPQK